MRTAPPWVRPARAWAINGRVLPVQCPPVLDLVPMLWAPPVYTLLGTLTEPDDTVWVYDTVLRYGSPFTDVLVGQVADALVWSWCGVPRWFARRLWQEILGSWALFEGPLSGHGVDISTMAAAPATRLVWSTLHTWHANEKDKGEAWRRRIEAPPLPPVSVRRRLATTTDRTGDAESFLSVFAAIGGRRS